MSEHMTPAQARKIAVQMLWEHGLYDWKVVMDTRAVARAGQCRYIQKEIGLSTQPMAVITYEGTLNTIRHEIAHALNPGNKHGARWRATYLRLGGNGQRMVDPQAMVKPVPGRYRAVCPSCGRESHMYRRPQVVRACGVCCNKLARGKFDTRFVLHYTDTRTGRLVAIGA